MEKLGGKDKIGTPRPFRPLPLGALCCMEGNCREVVFIPQGWTKLGEEDTLADRIDSRWVCLYLKHQPATKRSNDPASPNHVLAAMDHGSTDAARMPTPRCR